MLSELQLSLKGISKAFGHKNNRTSIIENFSLDIFYGEFLSVFGPNGCGKSTLLHIIANIISPDEGRVVIENSKEIKPRVGIVFQNYDKSLMPWRTCLDNIALPLEAHWVSRKERRERVYSFLNDLGLNLPVDQYPYQMSGGQKQLACIARAMIIQPSILLLDEPFVSLDYRTRIDMQFKLQEIWGKTRVTTILVSHEIDEAIFLADRFLLLTPLPLRGADSFVVPISRPRDITTLTSHTFLSLRSTILTRFTGEVKE